MAFRSLCIKENGDQLEIRDFIHILKMRAKKDDDNAIFQGRVSLFRNRHAICTRFRR